MEWGCPETLRAAMAPAIEFQQEFMIATMGPLLTAIDMPLVSVWNPEPQQNDFPDKLAIQ